MVKDILVNLNNNNYLLKFIRSLGYKKEKFNTNDSFQFLVQVILGNINPNYLLFLCPILDLR
jgi:hypothetical protein